VISANLDEKDFVAIHRCSVIIHLEAGIEMLNS